jgi:predicted Zn-dependent protease
MVKLDRTTRVGETLPSRTAPAFAIALLLLLSPASVIAARPQTGRTRAKGGLDKGALALRTGRYDEALRLCRARLARAPEDTAATVLCARAEQATGGLAEARRRLEVAQAAHPNDLPLRDALMRLYEAVGDRAAWAPLVDASYADWNGGHLDRAQPADLMAIATAVRLDENWKDANDVLRDAVRADRKDPAPNLDWGALLLEKHNAPDAETSFREVLKIDPENPDAHVGLARAALDDRYDAAAARAELARALAVNPAHAEALALRGELALDAEDFASARADVAAIRRVNPRDRGAARVEAAAAFLLDDRAGFDRARDVDQGVHPHDGRFFAFVAEALSRARRYEEARGVAAEGVAAAPDDAGCLSVLATTELRLGNETAGLELLRRSWKRDPYNLRTYNLLDLYEKVIPARYVTVASAHLRFRIEPAAKTAITEIVAPFLEERYRDEVARYGFEPQGPITFELYGDPRHFAVRTVGLPAIGVSGVCFGRIITSQAPTNHAFNWGMVLTHELSHVFAIELSRQRVPRWFTEGLSEAETARVRPEWRRHDEVPIFGALERGDLPPLAELSTAFVNARNGEDAIRAYAQAALAVEWLERRFGFAAVRAALVAYGRGERGAAVLEEVTGTKAAALDAAFRGDLAADLARYRTQYLPTQSLRVVPGPDARGAHAEAARGVAALAAGDLEGARKALERARAAQRPSPTELADTLFLAGEVALARRDADAAVAAFEGLLDLGTSRDGFDGYDARVRLGLAEIHRKHLAAAEGHLLRAVDFDPTRVEPRALLAELYADQHRDPERLTALEGALRLDPMNDTVAREVVIGEARAGHPTRVAEFGPIALFIDPADADLHAALGRALAATGKSAAAAVALEHALLFQPRDPAALHLTLAGLYDTLGERSRAAAHRAAARR